MIGTCLIHGEFTSDSKLRAVRAGAGAFNTRHCSRRGPRTRRESTLQQLLMASAYASHRERTSSLNCGVAHGSYQQKLGTNLCITTGQNAQAVDAIAIFTATPKLGTPRVGLVSLDPAAQSMRIPST